MPSLRSQLAVTTIALVACGVLSCDNYNIVEPRFYSEGDIVDIPICEGVDGETSSLRPGGDGPEPGFEVPASFSLDLCWLDKAGKVLFLCYDLPVASRVRLYLLGSGGYVVQALVDSTLAAGSYQETLVFEDDEDGVYALRMNAGAFEVTIWFEVE